MEQEQEEQWKVVKGYPMYEVSNLGRVKSNVNPSKPKLLRQSTNKNGYKCVALVPTRGYGKADTITVHRIVATTWIPNPNNYPHIDHINTDKQDNSVSNLRWVTPKLNAHNPITEKRRAAAIPRIVEKTSKTVLVYDLDFNLLSAFTSTAHASRELGLSQGNISNVCMGSLHSYKGLYFSFVPLYSQEDRDKVEQRAVTKRRKRLDSVNKACQKRYAANLELYREYGRKYYQKRKNAENLHGGGSSSKK